MGNTVENVENTVNILRGPLNRFRIWKDEQCQTVREYHIAKHPVHVGDRLHAWWGWLTVDRIEIHNVTQLQAGWYAAYYVFATVYCRDTMDLPDVPYQLMWRKDHEEH